MAKVVKLTFTDDSAAAQYLAYAQANMSGYCTAGMVEDGPLPGVAPFVPAPAQQRRHVPASSVAAAVVQFLMQREDGQPVYITDVEDAIAKKGYAANSASTALSNLYRDGIVQRVGRGFYRLSNVPTEEVPVVSRRNRVAGKTTESVCLEALAQTRWGVPTVRTLDQIEDAMKDAGFAEASARPSLNKLVRAGLVQQDGVYFRLQEQKESSDDAQED